jgi:tetratricopeptide (TPR) repeat protein
VARVGFAVVAIAACLLLILTAARFGFSRLLAQYAVLANSLDAADQAVQLTPADANAHRARATVLNRLHRPAEAEVSLETATRLRSRDDYLWLELGSTREELGDNERALAAFDQSVRCAPHYAHTHWRRGNLELRMGRYEQALSDLRQAVASDPKLLPNFVDLAWGISKGNAPLAEKLLEIQNDEQRLVFARYLARKGKGAEVAEQIRLLDAPLSVENKDELVRLLFAARVFREAFELKQGSVQRGAILNGGFEETLTLSDGVFGWILSPADAKTKRGTDVSEKHGGSLSFQVNFAGDWTAGPALLSQTVLVEPSQRYRLTFALRTQDLVTGGPPLISINDAATDQMLAQSEAFPQTTDSWQAMTVEFTAPASEAIKIDLRRESCKSSPCPIFGVVWLDDFSLQKL